MMRQQEIEPLPSPDGVRDRLANLTPEEFAGLQSIFRDRWRQNWLRVNGWLNVFIGGLGVWSATSSAAPLSAPRLLNLCFSLFLIGQSLWGIFAPSNAAVLRFAIILLIAGGWNLLVAIVSGFAGAGVFTALLGLCQLLWAWQSYTIYRQYRQAEQVEPRHGLTEFYDEAWSAITDGLFRHDPANIRLTIGRATWQGLLLEDTAVFARQGKKHLVVQRKAEANFAPFNARSMRQKKVAGKIKLSVIPERAVMQHDSFAKYALWKNDAVMISNLPPAMRPVEKALPGSGAS